jgi:hypothetical protein
MNVTIKMPLGHAETIYLAEIALTTRGCEIAVHQTDNHVVWTFDAKHQPMVEDDLKRSKVVFYPEDYEECGECGYDHGYETAFATTAHTNMMFAQAFDLAAKG